jgi:hypothetical protein
MKKKFLALLLLIVALFSFTACSPVPELDVDAAKNKLDSLNYYTNVYTYASGMEGLEKSLEASKNDDETLTLFEFKSEGYASIAYDLLKLELKNEIKSIKLEIKLCNYIIEKDATATEFAIEEAKEEKAEYEEELKKLEKIKIGFSGKFVWMGTERIIKDSK